MDDGLDEKREWLRKLGVAAMSTDTALDTHSDGSPDDGSTSAPPGHGSATAAVANEPPTGTDATGSPSDATGAAQETTGLPEETRQDLQATFHQLAAASGHATPIGPAGSAGATQQPLAQVPSAPAATMRDEDIAASIMDKQVAILIGWQTALQVFDKTMTSSADAEATPDFQKTVTGFFADKLVGALINHTPGASEVDAVVKALDGEIKRASAAGASAKLRDFVVQHAQAIGRLQQAALAQRQGFISAVQQRREAAEAPRPTSGRRGGKPGVVEPTQADNDYAMMRMALMDMLEQVDAQLKVSTPEALFRTLSEEWVRHSTVAGGMGTRFAATVVIRLNPDYSVKDAHIRGSGGQKLAEQLLKDSPNGVDVFNLKAPRTILLMADNGWPAVTLSLDANNRDISTGSFGEGNTDALRRRIMATGLPPTKNLTGD